MMAEHNLIELFHHVQPIVDHSGDYELQSQLAQLRDTYSTMLRYMVQGMDDPNASRIYADLISQTSRLGERANRLLRMKRQTSDKYVQAFNSLKPEDDLASLCALLTNFDDGIRQLRQEQADERESVTQHALDAQRQNRETALVRLFNRIWTADAWHRSELETVQALLSNDVVSTASKSLTISATTLSLLEMFDERKLMLLFDAYLTTDIDVSQRALVGIVLVLRQHAGSLAAYPEVQSRFRLLCDDPSFVSDTFRVMMQLQYSRMTDTVSEKMRSDIIPTILKSKNFKQTQYGIQEIDDYLTQNGENPEWFKNREADEQAHAKIREMAELQMEGADVYMATFSHMKSNAFFQLVPHWFYLFGDDIPEVNNVLSRLGKETANVFRAMLRYAPFCNSDRFSFSFMLGMIGEQGQEMLSKNLTANLSQDELSEMLATKVEKKRAADISRQYIFDLYRFFTLYPFHLQFVNPFDAKQPVFSPLSHTIFTPLLQHENEVITLAEFFMRKGVYQEAAHLFASLCPQQREEDADLWQKLGFCEQKLGRLSLAFEHYQTAYELNPNSVWTLKHLATVAFQSERWAEAEVYYETLLDDDADNVRYLRRKAGCLMNQQRYDEAIPVLYQVLYIDEHSVEDQNNMAWCQLLTKNIEKARELYSNVLSQHLEQPSAHFNLANTYLAELDIQQAYPLYRHAYILESVTDEGEQQFVNDYRQAIEALQPVFSLPIERTQALLDAIRLGI